MTYEDELKFKALFKAVKYLAKTLDEILDMECDEYAPYVKDEIDEILRGE